MSLVKFEVMGAADPVRILVQEADPFGVQAASIGLRSQFEKVQGGGGQVAKVDGGHGGLPAGIKIMPLFHRRKEAAGRLPGDRLSR